MIYNDKIYGKVNITEPIILELINCPAMQRLKKINQYGYIGSYLPEAKTNRFEHSMGVFCLLRKYGAPLPEQISGLLHDVSHSAFSHCIDYVFKKRNAEKQSHQDDIFDSHIRKTEIPKILKKHKINLNYILNDKNFSLKEKKLPDICADRIDYFLRDAMCFKIISKKDADYFIENLEVKNGRWFFRNYKSARKFSRCFHEINRKYYSGLPTALMFRTVGNCLGYALEKGYISEKDLYETDSYVISKIKKNIVKDDKLDNLWKKMNKKIEYKFSRSSGMKVICKSRAIDPFFIKDGKLLKVSDVDKKWKDVVKKDSKPKGYFVEFYE